jgi:hypothetical protein
VIFILVVMLQFFGAEVDRNSSFGEAAKAVLMTKLHWAILLGMGVSAFIWLLLWFGRLLEQHESRSRESGSPDYGV